MKSLLGDHVLLYRRYDPSTPGTVVQDQGSGRSRLGAGAFRWDEVQGVVSPERIGCSVYESDALERLNLSPIDCIEQPGWRLATVRVQQVHGLERSTGGPSPFEAVSDPVQRDPANRIDDAHALIWHISSLSGRRGWYRALAREFQL